MAGPPNSNDATETRDAFFTRIVHQHARLLYRVAHSVLRNPADAEDAVADALLKLLRTNAWQTISNERAFLARTVWRSALDRFEGRQRTTELDPDILTLLEDRQPSPEAQAVDQNERSVLHALIDRLPVELRQPLLLSAVQELNSREIAELMHLPEGTVRTRLMRARRSLREQYQNSRRTIRDREVAAQGTER